MGKQWKQCQTLFWGAPKSLQMVTAAMKLKDAYCLEGKLYQDPLPVEFSKQEYWSSLPCPPPGDLPDPGIKPDLLHCRQIPYHLSHLESQLKSHICMQTMNAVHL